MYLPQAGSSGRRSSSLIKEYEQSINKSNAPNAPKNLKPEHAYREYVFPLFVCMYERERKKNNAKSQRIE